VATTFQYDYFPVLHFETVLNAFPTHERDFLWKAYLGWFETFCSKAHMMYAMQLRNHGAIVWREFRRLHNLNEDDTVGEYGVEEKYDAYCAKQGYLQHEQACEAEHENLRVLMKKLMPNRQIWHTSTDGLNLYKEILDALASGVSHPKLFRYRLDPLWFDTHVANNDPLLAVEHNRLPYADYLNTPYWRRIRSAMLLIHRARCQGDTCPYGQDGSWLGDEKYMHVHHMTYEHRGCERFNELRLVCENCHEQLHKKDGQVVFSRPQLNFTIG
jgi:hypothetical protein